MKARDGPVIEAPRLVTVEPETHTVVTRHQTPVKRSELMTKRTRKPSQKTAKKPPSTPGYFFRRHGAGWDLRRDYYVTSHDGVKKRKQPYVAHMSGEAFRQMKERHKGASLKKAIAQWIADHDK
jgi:hypothetical protein